MTIQCFIIAGLITGIFTSCGRQAKNYSTHVVVQKGSSYEMEDSVEPPPPGFTSTSRNMDEWLLSICKGRRPVKKISEYRVGFFESSVDTVFFLTGINITGSADTIFTKIDYTPTNMYFVSPKMEYKNLDREAFLNRVASQLKAFTETNKFKTSFLSEADRMVLSSTGQTIWSNPE